MNLIYTNERYFQKSYGHQLVIESEHLTLEKGKVHLLIGENGAGKSTLIRLLLGLIRPTQGELLPFSLEVGYIPDAILLPNHLTVRQYLMLLCEAQEPKVDFGPRIETFALEWRLDLTKRIGSLSKGMKQKVLIIQALCHYPKVYIFDEPLNGLDQETIHQFTSIVQKLKIHKKTILIITHDVRPFASLWDIKWMLYEGKIVPKTR
ncbi:MAG: ATP-binding cassette domain-containing protein [Bacilli bacterium]|nr:ATP-binding cassette domain-containing protein [Bacilli bacterium]